MAHGSKGVAPKGAIPGLQVAEAKEGGGLSKSQKKKSQKKRAKANKSE